MLLRYVLAWVPMMFIGIINGAIREATYGKTLSELRAHQISTITGVLLLGLYIWRITRIWNPGSSQQAILIGILWVSLTVVFEFCFGHYIAGQPWNHLLRDYNVFAGRVWLLVLIWITAAPLLFYRFLP